MYSNHLNGGTRVIGIIAAELVARGHDVRVVLQPPQAPPFKKRARALVGHGAILRKRKDGPFLDPIMDRVKVLKRARPVRDADVPDADVVVATWWETAAWVNALSTSKGAKTYFMQDYGGSSQEFEKLIPTWQMPFNFITLNSLLQAKIKEQNPNAPVTIMRNAVDHGLFRAPARQRGTPPKIGLLFRTQVTKGMDVAAKALDRIHDLVPDVQAVAVGSAQSGLPEWVEIVEAPDDQKLAEIYRSCDLWLFPSRMEGFGLPIIEAMASRTPVISTSVGGAVDIIKDGVNGLLVDVDDVDAIVEKATALLTGPSSVWQSMSEAAYEEVAHYAWSDAVDTFEQALMNAANTV